MSRQAGMIASFTTDQTGGFNDEEVRLIKRVLPRFALVAKLAGRERLLSNVLEAYLGADAGRRVRDLGPVGGVAGAEAGGRSGAVAWDGRDDARRKVSSGTYFARLTVGGAARVISLTLVR